MKIQQQETRLKFLSEKLVHLSNQKYRIEAELLQLLERYKEEVNELKVLKEKQK